MSKRKNKGFQLYLDKDIVEAIEKNLLLGDSTKIALEKVGIPQRTFSRWFAAGAALLAGEETDDLPQLKRRGFNESDHAWEMRQATYYAKCELLVDFYRRVSAARGTIASELLQAVRAAGMSDSRNWPALMTILERTRDDFKQQTKVTQDVKIKGNIEYNRRLDNLARLSKKLESRAGSGLSEEERDSLALERLQDSQEADNE